MGLEVHCMSILHTKLLLFNYDKVISGLLLIPYNLDSFLAGLEVYK